MTSSMPSWTPLQHPLPSVQVTVEALEEVLLWREPAKTTKVFGAGLYTLICLRHLVNGRKDAVTRLLSCRKECKAVWRTLGSQIVVSNDAFGVVVGVEIFQPTTALAFAAICMMLYSSARSVFGPAAQVRFRIAILNALP